VFVENKEKILVIIPAYNEEGSIGKVIEEVRDQVPEADILVVNDGSTDATGNVAKEQRVLILEHPYNMGIGATMQTGFLLALRNSYDIAAQVDGDGQHDPQYLNKLMVPILTGEVDLVIGSRYLEEKGAKSSVPRRIGTRFLSILNYILTGQRVTDPTSGFRAINKKVIDFFSKEYPSDYPEAESLILLHKKGYTFKEVPAPMRKRQGGVSSIHFLSSIYYMVKVTLSMMIGSLKEI